MVKIKYNKVNNQITKDKCELCSIGIGSSVITHSHKDGSKTVEYFNHMENISHDYKWKDGILHICDSCYKDLKKMKKPTGYLRKQIYGKNKKKK